MSSPVILQRGDASRAKRSHPTYEGVMKELKVSGQIKLVKWEESSSGKGRAFYVPTKLDVIPPSVLKGCRLLSDALLAIEQKKTFGISYAKQLEGVETGSNARRDVEIDSGGNKRDTEVAGQVTTNGKQNGATMASRNTEDARMAEADGPRVKSVEGNNSGRVNVAIQTLRGIRIDGILQPAVVVESAEAQRLETNVALNAMEKSVAENVPAKEENSMDIDPTSEDDDTIGSDESMSLIDTEGCGTEQSHITEQAQPKAVTTLEANPTKSNVDKFDVFQAAKPIAKNAEHITEPRPVVNTGGHIALASFEIINAMQTANLAIPGAVVETKRSTPAVDDGSPSTQLLSEWIPVLEANSHESSTPEVPNTQKDQHTAVEGDGAAEAVSLASENETTHSTGFVENGLGLDTSALPPEIEFAYLAPSTPPPPFAPAYLTPSWNLHHTAPLTPTFPPKSPANNRRDRDSTQSPEPEPVAFDHEDITHHLKYHRVATSGFTDTWRMSPMGTASWLTIEGDTERSATFLNYASDLIAAHVIVYVVRIFDLPNWQEDDLGLNLLSDFLNQGPEWCPRDEFIQELDLVRGDTVFLPPFSIYKVECVSKALMSGGIMMRKESLREHFLAWKWDILGKTTRCFRQSREMLWYLRELVVSDPKWCGFGDGESLEEFEEDCQMIWRRLRLSSEVFLEPFQ